MKKALFLLTLTLFGYVTKAASQETNMLEPTEISPTPGSTVRTLELMTLTFAEDVNFNLSTVVTVTGAGTTGTGKLVYHASDYDKFYVKLNEAIQQAGTYSVTIPAGTIWDDFTEEKRNPELTYTYTVDPEYWDPEWIYEVGDASKSEENPFHLKDGFKFQLNQIHNYLQYIANADGRIIFTPIDNSKLSLTYHNEEWMWVKELPQLENGSYWLGVRAGRTYNIKDYVMFGQHTFKLTFEAGTPYEDIRFIESSPANGGKYNAFITGSYSHLNGAVDFVFNNKINTEKWKASLVLPTKGDKVIDITRLVKIKEGTAWKGYEKFGFYYSLQLAGLIEEITSEFGLKSGDGIKIVLSHIEDAEYDDNVLQEDVVCNLRLEATVCTSMNPHPNEKLSEVPQEVTFTFNNSTTGTGGRLIDPVSGEETAFDASCFSTSSSDASSEKGIVHQTTVKLPANEFKPTTRLFQIELFGMTDAKGNAVTYGDEEDKFIVTYHLRDDTFEPIATSPAERDTVKSIKETRLTFAENVHIAPNAITPILSNDGETAIEGILSIAADDPRTIIITWKEEVKAAGEYYISVNAYSIFDSKFDADKEDYGLADGASANPDISLTHIIAADFSSTTVKSISPENFESNQKSIEQLPAEITITFSGNPQKVNLAYGFGAGGMMPFATTGTEEIPENADILSTIIKGNQVTVIIPASVIAANKAYEYTIVLSVIGEDGKLIGANASDPFDAHVQFSYYLLDELTLTAMTPADGAQVESLKEITLTFETELYPTYDPNNITDEEEGWELPTMLTRINKQEVVADKLVPVITGNQAIFTLPEVITEEGIYELTIPGGVFYESTWNVNRECLRNEAKTLTFMIGDVMAITPSIKDSLSEDRKEVTVYSVTGTIVAQGKKLEVLQRLPKGIYIINGNKVVVNK